MAARLEAVHPVLMTGDVPASIRFFEGLGFSLAFSDSTNDPKYAGVRRDGVELHLQWHDPEDWPAGADRPTYRFLVDDVDAFFGEFLASGASHHHHTEVRDTPWGTREFHVLDPGRNGLQFYRDR